MKKYILILPIVVAVIFFSCSNEQNKKVKINPVEELEQVDKLLSEMAEKPQRLIAPTDKKTLLTGERGTIIHVDPEKLETIDGSALGDKIEIDLVEMTDNTSLLLQNAQTVSNGKMLVTGGAYYLNMTSNGKQLKMKPGNGLEVEFPKLTDSEMGLFIGERDSFGEINWVETEKSFESKNLVLPQKPVNQKTTKKETNSEIDLILGYVDSTYKPKPLTEEEIIEYKRRRKEYETASKTYEAVELLNFGWINCDRFLNDPNPKTDIQMLVKNDSLSGARMYAVFKDVNSIMTVYYWKGQKDTASFRNIPVGKEVHIFALSAKDETPYIFETTIKTAIGKQVEVDFTATTQEEIKEKLKGLN